MKRSKAEIKNRRQGFVVYEQRHNTAMKRLHDVYDWFAATENKSMKIRCRLLRQRLEKLYKEELYNVGVIDSPDMLIWGSQWRKPPYNQKISILIK
jgi:hypothetical protein